MSIENRLEPAGSSRRSSLVLEIRAAEGGDDAKALVREQLDIYLRVAARRGL
ncbi:MAG: PCRF domain-containing protein [Sandaracinus sp.]